MRVLVTGGSGFLGGNVAKVVQDAGHDVVIFDQVPRAGFECIEGNLLNREEVQDAVDQVDAVCHLAAVGDVYLAFENPPLAAMINAAGTAHVMEAAKTGGCFKVVYASTWEVYGEPRYTPVDEDHPTNPDHPYNITKLAGEHLVLSYDKLKNVPAVALRLGTAFGIGMRPNSVFSLFVDKAIKGEAITINGSGEQGRQFTHATDIGRAFVCALESDVRGEAFNIVSDEYVTIRDLAETVVRYLPAEVTYTAARVGDVPPARVSNRQARRVLGWRPQVSFDEGLQQLIAWHMNHTMVSA